MDHGSGSARIDCASIAPLLSDFVEERLEETTRQAVRAHLLGCAACARAAALLDPSILFMPLGQEAPKPALWAGFDASLRARLEAEKARPHRFWEGWDFRPTTSLGMPRLAFAAPLAMVVLLAGLVFISQPGMILRGPRGPMVEGIRPPNEVVAPVRPGDRAPFNRVAAGMRTGSRLATDTSALPTLEEVNSPAARVYRLDLGAAPATTPAAGAAGSDDASAVYFVVDETINF
ncbi:MAG TPA: zf-HC2 domain-containing protein [Candidatus Polarisedimenticolia bacterium]|nr:zf-HC2 domain-containing protein [Candidatus Polarisedimenticolia bacterium]